MAVGALPPRTSGRRSSDLAARYRSVGLPPRPATSGTTRGGLPFPEAIERAARDGAQRADNAREVGKKGVFGGITG